VKFTGNFVNDFIEVIERGGHSTYMVLIQPAETRIASYWSILKKLGCSYESAHIELSIGRRLLYSVDIPPTADIHEVYETLERGEDQGVWIFQEGYAHFPGSPRPACRPSDNGRWNQIGSGNGNQRTADWSLRKARGKLHRSRKLFLAIIANGKLAQAELKELAQTAEHRRRFGIVWPAIWFAEERFNFWLAFKDWHVGQITCICSPSQELSPRRETGRGLFESGDERIDKTGRLTARKLSCDIANNTLPSALIEATAAKSNWLVANADPAVRAGARRRHRGSRTGNDASAPSRVRRNP
jgi:hypothetical protein